MPTLSFLRSTWPSKSGYLWKKLSDNQADKGGTVAVLSEDKYIVETSPTSHQVSWKTCNPSLNMRTQFDAFLKVAVLMIITSVHLTFKLAVTGLFTCSLRCIRATRITLVVILHTVLGTDTCIDLSSKYIDSFIKPLVRKVLSFFEDTSNRITALTVMQSLSCHCGYRKFVYWPPGGANCF